MTERRVVGATPTQKSLSTSNFQGIAQDSMTTSNFQTIAQPKAPAPATTSATTATAVPAGSQIS